MGGGRDNVVEGNSIFKCTRSILFDNRGVTWMNLTEMYLNMDKVPYSSSEWIKKYPEISTLKRLPSSGIPYNNTVINNFIVDSGIPSIDKDVIENGTVKNNTVRGEYKLK